MLIKFFFLKNIYLQSIARHLDFHKFPRSYLEKFFYYKIYACLKCGFKNGTFALASVAQLGGLRPMH